MTRRVRTDVIYRYPSPEISNSILSRQTRDIVQVQTKSGIFEFNNDRYWVLQRDAFVAPRFRFLLDKRSKSVIVPSMWEGNPNPSLVGFGERVSIQPDGRQIVDLEISDRVIDEPCLFVCFTPGFGPMVIHGMLGLARVNAEIAVDLPILVPDDLDDRERGFLELLGLSDRRQISVPARTLVTVREAITPSKSFSMGFESSVETGSIKFGATIDPTAVVELSRQIRERIPSQAPKRLFISRRDATMRQLSNEEEALERLSRRNFERVIPTELTPLETARLFHDAECIVGPASSGMLNLIFSSPSTAVIEIDHPVNRRLPQAMCAALGMRFRPVGQISQKDRLMVWNGEDHAVDLDELDKVVSEELDRVGHEERPPNSDLTRPR